MPVNPDKEKNNPCLKEQELTFKCLNKNNYKHDDCEIYFANYNNCKEFWNKVKSDRRVKGIYPLLPDVEKRSQIKLEYMKTKPEKDL